MPKWTRTYQRSVMPQKLLVSQISRLRMRIQRHSKSPSSRDRSSSWLKSWLTQTKPLAFWVLLQDRIQQRSPRIWVGWVTITVLVVHVLVEQLEEQTLRLWGEVREEAHRLVVLMVPLALESVQVHVTYLLEEVVLVLMARVSNGRIPQWRRKLTNLVQIVMISIV